MLNKIHAYICKYFNARMALHHAPAQTRTQTFFAKKPLNYACEKGASLVEFAFVFPILITILLSTLELGIMLAIKVNLQSCSMAGAYYGATGAYTTGSTRTASATAVMSNGVSGLLNMGNVVITIQSFPNFSTASLGGVGTTGTGNPFQVGMYKIQYSYSPASPLVAAIFGATKILQATTYTKNEGTFPS